jgi:uncharacterized protein (DUF1778 family)
MPWIAICHDIAWQIAYAGGYEASRDSVVTTRTKKLDLRLTPAAKQTLYAAAAAERRSVSDFVLESALSRAAETLAGRQHFGLDAERWTAFLAALDAPARNLPRTERLLNEPSVFEGRDKG